MPTEHILIVDDSIAIASLLANEILPLGGYRATIALSGEEGLEIAQEGGLDLILCDLEMPGINGLDLLRELQAKGINVPAIMMTAFGSEAIAAQALRMGVKDYIIKPFTTEEILAAVERALVERRLRLQMDALNASLEELRQALVVIQAISQATETGLDPVDLLSRIILAAVYGGKAQGGFIARYDPGQGLLDVQAVANLPGWEGKEIDVISDRALVEAMNEGHVTRNASRTGFWIHIPLIRQGSPIGLMSIVSKSNQYPRYVEQLFSALAGYAAFVVENVRLRSDLAVAMLQGKKAA